MIPDTVFTLSSVMCGASRNVCDGDAEEPHMRAIVVENVMVRREREVLYLPAGPRFTLEGEIKNVVTVVAKTFHYWTQHQAAQGFGSG